MKVREVMSKKVVKVQSITMLPEAAQKMRQENIGVLPVEDNGRLIGVVTDRDITINAVAKGNIDRPIKEIMSQKPVTIGPDASAEEAFQLMLENNVRRLPVLENSNLIGMVSLEDLVEAGNDQELLKALRKFHKQTKHG